VPKGLRVRGARDVAVHSVAPGGTRTAALRVRVLRSSRLGTHRVRVGLVVGGRTVTRTIALRVTR
jgi:hypothetical protein